MFFARRRYQVTQIDDPAVLAEQLTQHTWTGCTAFQHHDLLFINASSSPDGAQEYAVIANGRVVESMTCGWCTAEKARHSIETLARGEERGDYGDAQVTMDAPGQHGTCHCCA